MKRWFFVACILIVAVLSAGCFGDQKSPPADTMTPVPEGITTSVVPTTQPPTPISQASVSDNTVTIRDFAFSPQSITVKTGDIVRWDNMDSVTHRIVFTDASGRDTAVDSNALAPSQSYSRKFTEPGSYPYYCKIHPEMKAIVIVE